MSNKQFECPRCYKRCGNAGALKTHEKPDPKSGSMLKWVVKRVKSDIKPKPKMAIELKRIFKEHLCAQSTMIPLVAQRIHVT